MNPSPALAGWTAGLVAGLVAVAAVPRLPRTDGQTEGDVLVVIPARDEADVLGLLLDDLRRQSRPAKRVVVVDDGSSDGTASLAAARGDVEVRRAAARPPGWNPKSWALQTGLRGATEAELVLLDADVRLARDALCSIVTLRRRMGGLVTVAPSHVVASWSEALSLPCAVVALIGAGGGAGAFGPCIALSRADLDRIGGYESIGRDLLDDIALAQRAAASGVAVRVRRGGDLVRVRMYRGGAGDVVEGWTKNLAAAAGRVPIGRALVAAGLVTASLLPLARLAADRPPQIGTLATAWLLTGSVWWVLARLVGTFPSWILATGSLPAVGFVALFARSAARLVGRRPVRWKGRWFDPRSGAVLDG